MFSPDKPTVKKTGWRVWVGLFLISLLVAVLAACFQPAPGYMDAEYYYSGGLRLAQGYGLTEEILWNYLDNPAGLPHPSHTYWMPLPSLLAAAGMRLLGQINFNGARLFFILLSALLPLLTGFISLKISGHKRHLYLSAGLALFSGFYLIYTSNVETFTPLMVLGSLFLIVSFELFTPRLPWGVRACLMGGLAGFIHLTRADGLLWLAAAGVLLVWRNKNQVGKRLEFFIPKIFANAVLLLAGYFLVTGFWYFRNWQEFHTLLSPGGQQALWLVDYDQTFIYPAGGLTFSSWLASGLGQIILIRLQALSDNLKTALAIQAEIFLLPLILMGVYKSRREPFVYLMGGLWLVILFVMSFIFPFAGSRGGFFHSGSGLQVFFWAIAPIGLDGLIQWGVKKRGWKAYQAFPVFSAGLLVLSAGLTGMLFVQRVIGPDIKTPMWGAEQQVYQTIQQEFKQAGGLKPGDIVMVNNPPGYYAATGQPAVVIPFGGMEALLSAAQRYKVCYLAVDSNNEKSYPELIQSPGNKPGFRYQGMANKVVLYHFDRSDCQ
jgi:hypothetical protein